MCQRGPGLGQSESEKQGKRFTLRTVNRLKDFFFHKSFEINQIIPKKTTKKTNDEETKAGLVLKKTKIKSLTITVEKN